MTYAYRANLIENFLHFNLLFLKYPTPTPLQTRFKSHSRVKAFFLTAKYIVRLIFL